MSSTTKIYEEKMNNCVAHLDREPVSYTHLDVYKRQVRG